ncbi:MAG TPA: hypothetical protein VIH90_02230 [Candidatus Saccharimonadales bacterium]
MPRLTNQEYLQRHLTLQVLWKDYKIVFGIVSPNAQWNLHRYYQTKLDLQDSELLARRKSLQQAEPSLAQRAGKTFRRIDVVARYALEESKGDTIAFSRSIMGLTPARTVSKRRIRISAVLKQEPDLIALTRALKLLVNSEQL